MAIRLLNENTVETVVLLSQLRQKPDDYIDVDVDVAELEGTSAETKATYEKIKKYVAEYNGGMKVSNLYIAQVKRKCGLELTENFNLPKSEDSRQPQCPVDKEKAIMDALEYFLEYYTMDDIDKETLRKYRQIFEIRNDGHVWNPLDDKAFLEQLGGYNRDRRTGVEGLTIAGLMMFGTGRAIRERFSNIFMDYREETAVTIDVRWNDRITYDGTWENNLFNFFSKVTPKLTEDLPKPFKLEGIQRIDETPLHKAVREAFVNLIIHADYLMDAGTLKVIKKNKSFEFTNSGILKLPVEDIFRGGNSKPRNSHMQTMLRMVGFGDNAGSGFPTIVAAWDAEGWVKPELIEDTILNQVTLKLDMVKAESAVEETTAVPKSAEAGEKSVQDKVIQYCKEPRTLVEIMEHLGFTSRPQFKKHYFDELIVSGLIKRTIPEKPSSPNQKYYS